MTIANLIGVFGMLIVLAHLEKHSSVIIGRSYRRLVRVTRGRAFITRAHRVIWLSVIRRSAVQTQTTLTGVLVRIG